MNDQSDHTSQANQAPSRTRRRWGVIVSAVVVAAIVVCGLVWMAERNTPVKDDEVVLLFPGFARQSADGLLWSVHVHGWIFEPEEDSPLRRAGLAAMINMLGISEDEAKSEWFTRRVRPFLVDNERGKRIRVRVGEHVQTIDSSGPNGHFRGEFRVPTATVEKSQDETGSAPDKFRLVVLLEDNDDRVFEGDVRLIPPTGPSVISDIDDTIKISEVHDTKALLANTFLRPFRPVDGMAELYRVWAGEGTCFHYVSASPWQLYEPLAGFTQHYGFPAGSFHLRAVRLKDTTALKLLKSSRPHKVEAITDILTTFPGRTFTLVGDSGEEDPEIYGEIARNFPDQVHRILIRDVTDEKADDARYKQAFADLPTELWQLFRDPSEVVPIP